MPGRTDSSAMALAAMTESPIAVTWLPDTRRGATAGAGPAVRLACWRGACARVAALMRSPLATCRSRPDGAWGALATPQPAVQATIMTAAARDARRATRGAGG